MVALHRLLVAVGTGEIDELCDQNGIDLLGVFGSAFRRFRGSHAPMPRDLDVSVLFVGEQRPLDLLEQVIRMTGYDDVDLAVLNLAHPVLRAEGMVGIGLYERTQGLWATTQMAAFAERRDTAWLRRLDLEILAG